MRPTPFLIALSLLFAVPAVAQNASTAGALELYPNLQAVGARLSYAGDANANATAHLEWRLQGAPVWQIGVDMTRITNNRWAGSVFWLDPNTAYEVRAVITDPDGGGSTSGTVRTRVEPAVVAPTRTWWVATNGNDANPGSSSQPFATLQAAANVVQPGEEIRVRPGIYYQTLDAPRAGTAGARIYLTADGPGVRLDGSDPAMLNRTDWRSDGGGVFSVPYTGSNRLVCVDSLQRLYKQSTLADLQSNANGVSQGFTTDGSRLYVKLEDGSSPISHTMHVARLNTGMLIDASYWSVGGFDIRYFGTGAGGTGMDLPNANGCWIWGNTIYTIGGKGIYVRGNSNDNLIERNLCYDPRIGTWPWAACKSHDEEIQGISVYSRRGNVVRLNTVRGTFDGIDGGDTSTEDDAADIDVNDNFISGVDDDGLEFEVFAGINARIWKNRLDDCYDCISVAPNYVGPEYVIYNTFTNFRLRAFKFSNSSTGQNWFCHNTVTSTNPAATCVWPTGAYSNNHFRNNILTAINDSPVSDDSNESVSGNDFNGDLLFTSFRVLFRWHGTDYSTLSALRSGTGFEMNGFSGNPLFASPAGGDYTLLPGSPAIDAAIRLPGINDRYNGAGPDIGSLESGVAGPDVTSPAAIRDLR
jgi:hypothetical protein